MIRKLQTLALPVALLGVLAGGLLSYAAMRNGATAAEPRTPGAKAVVVLVQNPKQLEVVLRTSMQMLDGKGFAVEKATVIVCGEGSQGLLQTAPQAEIIAKAVRGGVRVTVCGISLDKLQIDRKQLAPDVVVVENGLVELFRLKAEGYMSVEL